MTACVPPALRLLQHRARGAVRDQLGAAHLYRIKEAEAPRIDLEAGGARVDLGHAVGEAPAQGRRDLHPGGLDQAVDALAPRRQVCLEIEQHPARRPVLIGTRGQHLHGHRARGTPQREFIRAFHKAPLERHAAGDGFGLSCKRQLVGKGQRHFAGLCRGCHDRKERTGRRPSQRIVSAGSYRPAVTERRFHGFFSCQAHQKTAPA